MLKKFPATGEFKEPREIQILGSISPPIKNHCAGFNSIGGRLVERPVRVSKLIDPPASPNPVETWEASGSVLVIPLL